MYIFSAPPRSSRSPTGRPAGSLLRLAHPDMRASLSRGPAPLVAATPTDVNGAAGNGWSDVAPYFVQPL
ncbi:hypothetical protein ABGB16_30415 [Micromonospora sp. B11E3]|uniref:hypothetical protein n=1 Tax=Micromonospora sp. B11E3 TaxID=3153562 RepID=UPI00325D2708